MTVKKYTVGTGLTKEQRIKVSGKISHDEIRTIQEILTRIGAVSTFEGRVRSAEAWAKDELEKAGYPTDGQANIEQVQSVPWYANRVLEALYTIRKVKVRVAGGKGDEADDLARLSLQLGELLYEIAFKLDWEGETLFGIKSRQDRKEGPKARKLANDQRNEFLRQQADILRKKGKTSKTEMARHILSRAEKAARHPGAEGFWADISKMDAETIRKII